MTTERLYYEDCYLREFRARVLETADNGRRVYLDRTSFYPTSGGQPFDTGTLSGANVVDVIDEDGERVAHVLDAPISLSEIDGRVDWPRRFDHMQQHTGQHLLSAVLEEMYEIPTISFHMGADVSTIEIAVPGLNAAKIERAEQRCAEIVAEARPVAITFDDASGDLGLRKPSERTGVLRVISIDGIDKSACGGTHVRSTAEIGPVLIRKIEKIRGNVRLEFVCGLRALRHAKADFATLQELSRLLSVPANDTPALVSSQIERMKSLEKSSQKLIVELAQLQGRELWNATAPRSDGLRCEVLQGPLDDALRARAQAFVANGKAVFVAWSLNPPAVLLAASADSGIHAGERIKAAITAAGGKGGGNAALAQGSLPVGADVEGIAGSLLAGY